MTTLSIIVDDSKVIVDGVPLTLDFSPFVFTGIHAVHFDGTSGEVEYKDINRFNEPITSLDEYQEVIAAHAAELVRIQEAEAANVPPPPTYRDRRLIAYAALSPENDVIRTIGDVLDAVIKAQYGDSTELDQLAAQINQIKQQIPET